MATAEFAYGAEPLEPQVRRALDERARQRHGEWLEEERKMDDAIMRYFEWQHLPAALQEVSMPFGELAGLVHMLPDNPERAVALRKLLEAKDAAVRAALPPR